MTVDFSEVGTDENWELFARDLLAQLGFVIEVGPGRGADQGKDLIVSEQISGKIATKKFVWLVSCKYFTKSGKSVGTDDEINIIDRINHHKCDGFMGFYSTVSSSSLIEKLGKFVEDGKILQYELFDRQKISALFYNYGRSKLALRYFPNTYRSMRPIQKILKDYVELPCEICHKDVLVQSVEDPWCANLIVSHKKDDYKSREEVLICHKGKCDEILQERLWRNDMISSWCDIGDLCNPLFFIEHIMSYMNQLYGGHYQFTDKAHDQIKHIYIALSQRNLREITEEDYERFKIDKSFRF